MGKEINVAALKEAIGVVNDLKVEGIDKIRTVGIKKESMALLFMDAVANIDKIDENLLPQSAVDVYNELPSKKDLVAAGGTTEKKAKKTPAAKKEKKEKKPPVEKSRYGHTQNAKSGQLDDAFFEGGTITEIMESCGVPRNRFNSHMKHLRDDLGLTVNITKDKDGDALKDFYQVKEEKYTK